MHGKIRDDVRDIINTLCKYKNVEIIAGAVCIDHVHLSVAIPPKLSVSNFMGYLKGKSTLMIYDRHPELQSKWDKAFWASSNIALWRANNKPPLEVVVANLAIILLIINYPIIYTLLPL